MGKNCHVTCCKTGYTELFLDCPKTHLKDRGRFVWAIPWDNIPVPRYTWNCCTGTSENDWLVAYAKMDCYRKVQLKGPPCVFKYARPKSLDPLLLTKETLASRCWVGETQTLSVYIAHDRYVTIFPCEVTMPRCDVIWSYPLSLCFQRP